MKITTKNDRRVRIQLRQRKRIAGSKERPRLSVFRSVTHIYAQVIDDMTGETLVSASTVDPKLKGYIRPRFGDLVQHIPASLCHNHAAPST